MNKPLSVSKDVLALNPGLEKELATVPASKYHNIRAETKGLRFQSGYEAAEISKLILAEEQKCIFGLRLQVRFPLPGSNVYVADAVFCQLKDGKLELVVLDAKGYETPEFKIKARLFKERYGQEIELI